jgi:hypothetical protein
MILHKIYLVIFLIFINLKIANRLYYKLMQKVILSLYVFNIYNLITNFLIIKFNKYIFQINSNFYSNSNLNRKDHTSLKASYNNT